MMKPVKSTRSVLCLLLLIVLAGGGLRLRGLAWGVPNSIRHTPLYVDEYSHLWMLGRMNPARFNFNPHHFIDPSFLTYQYGIVLKVLSAAGKIHLTSDKDYYLRFPGEYAKLYMAGRGILVAYGTGLILLVFFIARRLTGSDAAALASAFFYALSPLAIISCYVIDIGVSVSFWLGVSFYFLLKAVQEEDSRSLWIASFATGLAFTTKYTTAPFFLCLLYGLYAMRSNGMQYVKCALFIAAAFLIGTPYALLDYKAFFSIFFIFTGQHVVNLPTSASGFIATFLQYRYATGTFVAITCAAGVILAIRNKNKGGIIAALYLIPYLILLCKSELHVTRYLNETFPFLFPFFGFAFLWAWASPRRRWMGGALLIACCAVVPYSLAVTRALTQEKDPRDEASLWIDSHIPAGSDIGVQDVPDFKTPGHLYMLYWKGTRYPAEFVPPPDFKLHIWNEAGRAWPAASPAYWIEVNGFYARPGKFPAWRRYNEEMLATMRAGYHPIQTFEHRVAWGPFHYRPFTDTGSDWQQFFPTVRIYEKDR